jgi:hypothetical protein
MKKNTSCSKLQALPAEAIRLSLKHWYAHPYILNEVYPPAIAQVRSNVIRLRMNQIILPALTVYVKLLGFFVSHALEKRL